MDQHRRKNAPKKADLNRITAYKTLLRMEEDDAYSNLELNHQIGTNRPDSPAFVRELVYGVLENKTFLDYYIQQLLTGKHRVERMAVKPRTLLRMGIYQIQCMDSVPEYAAVNETMNLASAFCPKFKPLINGILRNYLRKREELISPFSEKKPVRRLANGYSFAPWIAKLWLTQFGVDTTEALMKASHQVPPLTVRVNTTKISREDLKNRLNDKGILATERPISDRLLALEGSDILQLPEYKEGLFSVQDGGSVSSIQALDPKPGDFVVDVCTAPGGKSLACAEQMENQGEIHAFDIYPKKLSGMMEQAKRLGIDILQVEAHDAQSPNPTLLGKADRVICDVPCTGLGVVRRKPEIKFKELRDFGKSLAEKQLTILEASIQYLKPEGTLVYSTCTINRIENQDVVEQFLARHPEFQKGEERQLLPTTDGTDGFYYCILRKHS